MTWAGGTSSPGSAEPEPDSVRGRVARTFNKIPAAQPHVSEETRELRRLLRQDIRDAVAEVGRDVQSLHREVQLMCPRGCAGADRPSPSPGSVVPELKLSSHLQEAARDAVAAPRAAQPAGDGAGGDTRPSPCGLTSQQADPHKRQATASKNTAAISHGDTDDNTCTEFTWEWQRSNGDWGQYSVSQSHHIEKAWREGASRVRLRSTAAAAPLEIFLVDMKQLDPMSGRCRNVRRTGRVTTWRRIRRNSNAIQMQIRTGQPRFESMDNYKTRQDQVNGSGSVTTISHRLDRITTQSIMEDQKLMKESYLRYYLKRVVRSGPFSALSMMVTVWQAIWIAVDVDKNGRMLLFEKASGDIAIEYFFCAYFLCELLLRLFATTPTKACLQSRWFVFDLVCVAGSLIEAVLIPTVNLISRGAVSNWKGFSALRLVRLAKILRICRVFGASSDAAPFFKGLLSGLRSSLFIWAILVTMLFVFGILIRMNSHEDVASQYFDSVPAAMKTLITKGIFLDDTGELLDVMIHNGDLASLFLFSAFVFLGLFNLLNMLMGTFCAVAGEVAASERDTAQVDYLRAHLESIVDCYIHDQGLIGRDDFQLIIKNADVHRTLAQCGTDMEELKSLESLMFERREEITFETFFSAIVHLRKGKVATVKDIMHVQETLARKLEAIEGLLDPTLQGSANSAPGLGV